MDVLTCAHCGEPIDHADGMWFHPYRRFRSESGNLPTLCDYGDRVGPTHASPMAVTPADKDLLSSMHVAADEESFLLEALWLDWRQANRHRGTSACGDCGATPGGQHSISCNRRAPMSFDGSVLHHKHATRHP